MKPTLSTIQQGSVWPTLKDEIEQTLADEPTLEPFIRPIILQQTDFGGALAALLAQKLACPALPTDSLRQLILEACVADAGILDAAERDLLAFYQRDPACDCIAVPFLYYKGFQGLQMYRIGHWLWRQRRTQLAHYIQSRVSEVFAIDIHPAARIGGGILIDHATAIVIGETAVVGDNVSMLHEVTLGGTGNQTGDRHPKVMHGVLIGAGAKILGNVTIGEGAKVGAGSVVLGDVPRRCTVAGVPAKPVGGTGCDAPALDMDHSLS